MQFILEENCDLSLEFASNPFQDVTIPKFTKFPYSFSYIY